MENKKSKKSKKVPAGRTVQTRDEFLKDGADTKKDHPNKKDLYRRLGVLESNDAGELAVIKLGTKGRHKLQEYQNGKSSYNAYIVIEDNNGKHIKIDGVKFIENSPKRDLPAGSVEKILHNCLENEKTSKDLKRTNKANLDKIRSGRQKKDPN